MKLITKLIIIFFFVQASAQKNKNIYSCEKIRNVIIDSVLYDKLENGKLIFFPRSNKLFRIIVETDRSFIVSKTIKNKIRKSIRINKCENIKITGLLTTDDVKIIRD